jgi:hypothetical protein
VFQPRVIGVVQRVDAEDLVTGLDQPPTNARSNETGTTCDKVTGGHGVLGQGENKM